MEIFLILVGDQFIESETLFDQSIISSVHLRMTRQYNLYLQYMIFLVHLMILEHKIVPRYYKNTLYNTKLKSQSIYT